MSDPNTPVPAAVVEPPAPAPLASLLVPLEDNDAPETPPAAATPPTETPSSAPAAVTPPAPAPEPPKMVPLAAVMQERDGRKEAERQLRDARPLIEALNANPDLVAMLQQRLSGQPAPAPNADQAELEDLAKTLILYSSETPGQLDLEKAKRVREYFAGRTKAEVREGIRTEVEPLRQAFVGQQAQSMREKVENAAKQHGLLDQVRPLIEEAMQADPHGFANDPRIGAALIVTAAGLRAFSGGAPPTPAAAPVVPATPPAPPLVTEDAGRRPTPTVELDPHMQRLAKRRGWSPADMAKSLARVESRSGHVPVEKE